MVTEYDTLDELWLDAASQIITNGHDTGSRDGQSREILGFVGRLTQPSSHFMFNPIRKMSPSYAAAEMLWYLSGWNTIGMVGKYAPQYERFCEKDAATGEMIANGAYGHRWKHAASYTHSAGGFNQIDRLRELLKEKQETRQAVMTMYWTSDLFRAEKSLDVPCTLSLHFIVRDKKLNLVATMRSNDIWLGMPYDVFCFTSLQILVAQSLGLQVGFYQHQATSLHIYERNKDKFQEAASPSSFSTGPLAYIPTLAGEIFWDGIGKALGCERWNRDNKVFAQDTLAALGQGSLLAELCVMAATKWSKVHCERIGDATCNSLMKNYIEEFWIKGD